MAISFNKTKGKAESSKVAAYKYKDGDNTVRIFGGILPRYIYWTKNAADKDIPIECLSFNRETERFDNAEVDHVRKAFPELRCSWNYTVNCLDLSTKTPCVLHLKKKLFEQILTAAEDLGDPTDPITGWDIVFKRVKTGPLAFNVEYTLKALACKPRALSEEELSIIAAEKSIDEKYPRPTPDEVLATIKKLSEGAEEGDEPTDSEKEAIADLE